MCEIDDHVDGLDISVVVGGWQSLCAGILLHTVSRIERNAKQKPCLLSDTSVAYTLEGETAERWIEGGKGTVRFEDVCEVLNLNPGSVRRRCDERAKERRRKPQSDFTKVVRPRLR